jgi:hypothetical protein
MGTAKQSCVLCPSFRNWFPGHTGRFLRAIGCRAREFQYLHGSARWADLSDIKAAGLLNNDGVYVGAWRDRGGKSTICGTPAPNTSFCYAPTRSGKGVGLIVPTLLSWKQSVFVTDLKGVLKHLRRCRRCNGLSLRPTSVCGCQGQKKMPRVSFPKPVTWWSIAPVSRQSTVGSPFISRMKPSRPERRSRRRSEAIHFLVYQRHESKLFK